MTVNMTGHSNYNGDAHNNGDVTACNGVIKFVTPRHANVTSHHDGNVIFTVFLRFLKSFKLIF